MTLAIVGIFYDGYKDCWEDFIRLFLSNWKDCPYELYIVNNTEEISMTGASNIHVIHAGANAEYSMKVQTALNKIDADYYLLMLEDFFFGNMLNKDCLSDIINYIRSHRIKYYALSSMSSFTKYKSKLYDPSKDYLYEINPNRKYTLGCQAVIWEKSFLSQCIGTDNYNAWVFEGALSKSKEVHTKRFLKNCVKDDRNILGLKHGILQGKMIPSTVRYFKKQNSPLQTTRVTMSKKDYCFYVIKSLIAQNSSTKLRNIIKRIVGQKKNGAVIDKYSVEIDKIIKANFGE